MLTHPTLTTLFVEHSRPKKQLGKEFSTPQLRLIWSNYLQQQVKESEIAHGVGEGSIGKLELAILVGHIFDAMAEPVCAAIENPFVSKSSFLLKWANPPVKT